MLTDQQKVDVRRFAGYSMAGGASGFGVVIYTQTYPNLTLEERLDQMSPAEEAVLIEKFLTQLTSLETDIPGAAGNLDTAKAAVWEHNAREVADRENLFDGWRRRMCQFLGIPPGPSLSASNSIPILRA